jgi:shikimate dehydrogenase
MPINNETKLFISIASKPGNFGATVYESLFKTCGINAVYLPRKAGDPKKLVDALKCLDILGCSVSMPLKSVIIDYLDDVDPLAKELGSVNTIVNQSGKLIGYNTDTYGVEQALSNFGGKSVVVYGAGSVTHSIVAALQRLSIFDISIVARRQEEALRVASKYGIRHIENIEQVEQPFDLLINATPASLEKEHDLYGVLPFTNAVFDLVVSSDATVLEMVAAGRCKNFIPGIEMSKYQLQKQFEYYTNLTLDIELIDQIIRDSFSNT